MDKVPLQMRFQRAAQPLAETKEHLNGISTIA
jgi:hypothetical protein